MSFSRSALVLSLSCMMLTQALPVLAEDLREIRGKIMVLERMALPENTVIMIDLSDGTDTSIASQRTRTEGAQSPFLFEISAPKDQVIILRAGLRAGDDMLWLTEPRQIEPGEAMIDLGDLRALRTPAMGFSSVLQCGTQIVEIGFVTDEVRLRLNEQVITLAPQPAASGALYVAADNPATSIHLKEDTALLTVDGATLAECTLIRPKQDITAGVWNISTIRDKAAIFPSRTELVFFPDGRLSASVGCNRFIGAYRRHGGFLSFGRVASTMMGCPDGLGEQEAAFSAALGQVDGYSLNAEGTRLTLTAAGETVIQARR